MLGQKKHISPFWGGIVIGLGAALVQAYFKVIPPLAYGICMVCHARDLFNWLSDRFFGTSWGFSMASSVWPLLTVVGVVIGALAASARHAEFSPRSARQPLMFFTCGFLIINAGLLLGSCPIRMVILSAYGDVSSMIAWVCVAAGVVLASLGLKWNARRAIRRMQLP